MGKEQSEVGFFFFFFCHPDKMIREFRDNIRKPFSPMSAHSRATLLGTRI